MKNRLVLVCMALFLANCASAAKPGAMMAPLEEGRLIAQSSPAFQSMSVADIAGGKETSPLWKSNVSNEDFAEALRQSLSAHTMLAINDAKYGVAAELVEVKQPLIGLSFTVTTTVKYTVSSQASGQTIFETEIVSPYTAKMSDAFVGVERLRLANEGSIRENITQFIDVLIAETSTNPAFNAELAPMSGQPIS